jgi:ectoine hydroxylase-related dioxygenase (phytanoyl-CoA dioxygenase family)
MNTGTAALTDGIDFDKHAREYRERGYTTFERVVPDELLEDLRDQCQRLIDELDAEMDALGVDRIRINERGSRYFVGRKGPETPALRRYLLGDVMADVVRATLGPNAYLFYDQYVVKGADKGAAFAWHQDGAYVHSDGQSVPHANTVACWCPLDDVSEENGTVYLLPYERAGTRELVPHEKDPVTNDLVGYTGDDPGEPVIVPAGSIVCFSGTVLHRSGPNKTSQMRRVYLADYSPEPIYKPGTTEPLHHVVPFLKDGERVAVPCDRPAPLSCGETA